MMYALKNKVTGKYYTGCAGYSNYHFTENDIPKTFKTMNLLESHLSKRMFDMTYSKLYSKVLLTYDVVEVFIKSGNSINESNLFARIKDNSIRARVCLNLTKIYMKSDATHKVEELLKKKNINDYKFILYAAEIVADKDIYEMSVIVKKALGKDSLVGVAGWRSERQIVVILKTEQEVTLANLILGSFCKTKIIDLAKYVEDAKKEIEEEILKVMN